MSDVVVPDPVAAPPTRSELVVAALSEPGLDLVGAQDRVRARIAAQRSRWWTVAGAIGAVAVVAGVLLVVLGNDGDDLRATDDESTTTTITAPSTVPEGEAAIPVAPVTTGTTVPAADAVAPPVAPESSSPLTARLSLPSSVSVGAPFTMAIDWNDADHAATGEPSVTVEWNDPFLTLAAVEPPPSACSPTGTPRTGRLERSFRYSTPGRRTISVRLRSCTGAGALAEDTTVEVAVDVRGLGGTPLVVGVDGSAGDPDAATALRYPAAATGAEFLANRSSAVRQVLRRDPGRRATVLTAASWGPGDVLVLEFPDGSCRAGELGGTGASEAAVLVESTCQPVLPTTTTTVPPSSTTSTPSTTSTVPDPPGSP